MGVIQGCGRSGCIDFTRALATMTRVMNRRGMVDVSRLYTAACGPPPPDRAVQLDDLVARVDVAPAAA
jgi:hypothetical protein